MKVGIIHTNANAKGKSASLALLAQKNLEASGVEVDYIDLAVEDLPMCDGGPCYGDARVIKMTERVQSCDGLLVASPIYNYTLTSHAKNFLELTGKAWEDKPVSFLCAAGGQKSYMACLGFANSLMLDHRCLIVPRFVYATGEDFGEDNAVLEGGEVAGRIEKLCAAMKPLLNL